VTAEICGRLLAATTAALHRPGMSTRQLILGAGLVCLALAGAPAEAKSPPKMVFKNAPAAVAPRLASECTRRRMALIQNTPEKVVCKYRGRFAELGPDYRATELWTFELKAVRGNRTQVRGATSVEAATEDGYAVISTDKGAGDGRDEMRSFLRDVAGLDGMRGPFRLLPETLTN
jgi:hypothetical protein